MHWVAPTEEDEANHQLEQRLWDTTELRYAQMKFADAQYSAFASAKRTNRNHRE